MLLLDLIVSNISSDESDVSLSSFFVLFFLLVNDICAGFSILFFRSSSVSDSDDKFKDVKSFDFWFLCFFFFGVLVVILLESLLLLLFLFLFGRMKSPNVIFGISPSFWIKFISFFSHSFSLFFISFSFLFSNFGHCSTSCPLILQNRHIGKCRLYGVVMEIQCPIKLI